MTLEPLGFPGPQQHGLGHRQMQEILRRVRKPLAVDPKTMWMRETSGGTVIGTKAQARGTVSTIHRWFRVLSDVELADCVPSETNTLKCRDTLGCGGDDVPSLYGIWSDLDPVTCAQTDQDTTCTLIYFPSKYVSCLANTDPDVCDINRWTGLLIQAFWNEEHGRWESDSVKDRGDVMDFVEFCDLLPILSCGGGNCPDPEEPIPETCCIFDGRVRRDIGPIGDTPEDCTYQCGARNTAFDVWILCSDRTSLPAGQTCFPARRIDDAFTTQYCPDGLTGPMITETRPVYSIGCCGCGCPLDELYLEFNFTRQSGVTDRIVIPGCETNGMSVTVKLTSFVDPMFPSELQYKGYFCRSYEIPVFLAMIDDPADPHPVYLRPDCTSGAPMSGQFADVGDLMGLSGCCYTGTSGFSADPQFFQNKFDVYKQYTAGGTGPTDPIVCEDIWQTCKFCYEVRLSCHQGDITNLEIQQVLPPGLPHYVGTPQEDPTGPLENLIPFGDTQALSEISERCGGRNYYETDLHFGNVDPITLLTPTQAEGLIGWPHLYDHVFGGCCWDHVVLGTTRGVCHGAVKNICACCGFDETQLDDCRTTVGVTCNPKAFAKVSWNCRNDMTWG